eukprot:scaffold2799_cov408-Prasinococcus_capsulatus_cf.AAC.17
MAGAPLPPCLCGAALPPAILPQRGARERRACTGGWLGAPSRQLEGRPHVKWARAGWGRRAATRPRGGSLPAAREAWPSRLGRSYVAICCQLLSSP